LILRVHRKHRKGGQAIGDRQQRKVTLGGLIGTLSLEGDLGADLAHLLRVAEILHVGKGATFGLGKIEVE